LESKGYYTLKLIKTNKNGIPDIVAIHPQSEAFFVEVKKSDGKESKLQEVVRKGLNERGIRSYVAYGYSDYMEKIGQYL
jgi:Holliday junction resolvase